MFLCKRLCFFGALFSLTILSGCSKFYGVNRHLSLSYIPASSTDCIETALASVDGVDVQHKYVNSGVARSDEGDYAWKAYTYAYVASTILVNLRVTVYPDSDEYRFSQSYEKPFKGGNDDIDRYQREVDIIRPVMVNVEGRIEKECGILNFQNNIKESCSDVQCKHLSPLRYNN